MAFGLESSAARHNRWCQPDLPPPKAVVGAGLIVTDKVKQPVSMVFLIDFDSFACNAPRSSLCAGYLLPGALYLNNSSYGQYLHQK